MPEDWTSTPDTLCALGPTPQIMTSLFLTWLREHFSDSDNIEHAIFRDRLWDSEACATRVMIEDATVWTPEMTQRRPALLVKRNSWEHTKRFTFDSQSGTTEDGRPTYTKLWRGSHTIFAVSPEGGECEILVAETYRFLMHFGPIFRQYFNLMKFELLQVGELSMIEETSKAYACPITVAYGWQENWAIRPWGPNITDLRLSQIFETYYG